MNNDRAECVRVCEWERVNKMADKIFLGPFNDKLEKHFVKIGTLYYYLSL